MAYNFNDAIFACLVAFALSCVLAPLAIPLLRRFKFGQNIRSDGPASHAKKAGTPTMGGIIIVVCFALSSLPFLKNNKEGAAVLLVTAAFGLIGFIDDYISIKKKRSLGLRAYQKLLAQIGVSVVFFLFWRSLPSYSSEMIIPFFPGASFDAGFLFPVVVCLVFLGSTNGANLTDGLDGLAAGVTVFITAFLIFAAAVFDSPTLPVVGAAAGSLLGFLLFNSHPAKIIMGDTGSLALGGLVAALSLVLRTPLFLFVVAVIYVIESLSVMLQVGYFKLTKKRIFKMAPIHHSFELSGWAETKITAFFYIITVVACLIGCVALTGF